MTTVRIMDDEKGITPVFETRAVRNEAKSKAAGMAMYDDVEFCRIYIAGFAKEKQLDAPAHDVWSMQNRMGPDGTMERVPVTYAERFTKQYQQFKSGNSQTFSGTPLTELTSLTPAQRSMLKGLQIHTLQALAAIDGISLKQLGAGGRELKNAALAFLERAKEGALTGAVADKLSQQENEIEKLKAQLAGLANPTFPVPDDVSQLAPVTTADVATYETFNDDDLRNMLEAASIVVDGRWSRNTLITKCKELKTKAKVAA